MLVTLRLQQELTSTQAAGFTFHTPLNHIRLSPLKPPPRHTSTCGSAQSRDTATAVRAMPRRLLCRSCSQCTRRRGGGGRAAGMRPVGCCGLRLVGVGLGVVVYGLWGVGCGLWVVVCGLWVVVCGLWFVGCGLWVVGCGLWVVVCGLMIVVCGLRFRVLLPIFSLICSCAQDWGGSSVGDLTGSLKVTAAAAAAAAS